MDSQPPGYTRGAGEAPRLRERSPELIEPLGLGARERDTPDDDATGIDG